MEAEKKLPFDVFNLVAKHIQNGDHTNRYTNFKKEFDEVYAVKYVNLLSKEELINRLMKRVKDAFDNEFHKHEHKKLLGAIYTIEQLVPPEYFSKEFEK